MNLEEAKEILKGGGFLSPTYGGRNAGGFLGHLYRKGKYSDVVNSIVDAMRVYMYDQESNGWADIPENYRGDAVNKTLHLNHKLKIEFKRSIPYQAYYATLSNEEQHKARQKNNHAYN